MNPNNTHLNATHSGRLSLRVFFSDARLAALIGGCVSSMSVLPTNNDAGVSQMNTMVTETYNTGQCLMISNVEIKAIE
ncbi:hypothetical protein [Oceanisphaera sp. IT1-181]|uniref:hypothetical protein n=1 Tax=Oceanisphaera sp. IT1-181 TaxID=3081199 RepID=UPI0029C9CF6B|nr:hypothetical protein [Oceanisphaera sp. IT1-181]